MRAVLIAVGAAVAGGLLTLVMLSARNAFLRRKKTRPRRETPKKPRKVETMKLVVWACVINGFMWVWCSYILAWMDKPQIAEELSKVALAEIIAPVAVYAFKSAVENLSKNNRWPDKGEPLESGSSDTSCSGENEGGVG